MPSKSKAQRLSYRMRLIVGSHADEKFCLAAAKVDRKIRQRLEKMKHLDALSDKKAQEASRQDKILEQLFAQLAALRCDLIEETQVNLAAVNPQLAKQMH